MKSFKQFIQEAKHGPTNPRERRQQRGVNLSKILKRRLGTKANIRGLPKEFDHTTDDPDDVSTEVKVFENPAQYAASSTPKVNLVNGNKKTLTNRERATRAGRLLKQVTFNRRNPNGQVTSNRRRLLKQVTFNIRNPKGQVAVIDIKPNQERPHGDFKNIKQRTKNLKNAAENAPNVLRKAGVKPGATIIAKPGQTQEGGPEKAGQKSRERLYKKMHPGLSKVSPTTGRMKGTFN